MCSTVSQGLQSIFLMEAEHKASVLAPPLASCSACDGQQGGEHHRASALKTSQSCLDRAKAAAVLKLELLFSSGMGT